MLVIGFNYGCECKPVLEAMAKRYPDLTFEVQSYWSHLPDFSLSWSLHVNDNDKIDEIRAIASAFRDGYSAGHSDGWDACLKHESR